MEYAFALVLAVSVQQGTQHLEIPLEAPKMPQVERILSLQDMVAQEFQDAPRMMKVIACESNFRQFDSSGKPLMSHTADVGIFQVNQVHWDEAKSLGLDIFNSAKDNIKMGRIIYDREGIDAWTCNKLV